MSRDEVARPRYPTTPTPRLRSSSALTSPALSSVIGDEDAEIDPVSTGEGGGKGEIETDRLSAIVEEFNDRFGGIEWGDPDRVIGTATVDIPASVSRDARFENARRNSDRENPHVESDNATERAVLGMVRDNTQLFKLFADDPDFKRWLTNTAFRLAYEAAR